MKKLFTILMLAMLALNSSVAIARPAAIHTHNQNAYATDNKAQYDALVNRVYAIRDMDKTNLSANEKLALRTELNSIKNKLSDPNFTGLYLSSGVIIIILIVLLVLALR